MDPVTPGKTPARRRRIGLFLYALALVGFMECGARILFSFDRLSQWPVCEDDLSWRRFWVSRHRRDNADVFFTFDRYDPTKGWISKANVRNLALPWIAGGVLNTNAQGFRSAVDFSAAKSAGTKRILVLGDSFTFSEVVRDDETYPHYLQVLLPRTEVFNLGVHGYGHDQMLILFREFGPSLKPDIVILGYITYDKTRNLLAFRDYAKPKFVMAGDDLALTNSPVPRPEEILRWDWLRPRLYDVWSLVACQVDTLVGRQESREGRVTRRILDELVAEIVATGAVPVFAYIPGPLEVGQNITEKDPNAEWFADFCRANGTVRCTFLFTPFRAAKNSGMSLAAKLGHWGALGNSLIAEGMRDFLVAEGLVTANGSRDGTDAAR